MSTATSTIMQPLDAEECYQAAYDALGQAYWDASDIQSKDLVHGAQEAIGDILTALDEDDLAKNTKLFIELTPKIKGINKALQQIQLEISAITKNIDTASKVLAAITKVLSVYPGL